MERRRNRIEKKKESVMGGGALIPWQFVTEAIELDFVFTGELLGEVNHRMGELPRLWRSGGTPDAHWVGSYGHVVSLTLGLKLRKKTHPCVSEDCSIR